MVQVNIILVIYINILILQLSGSVYLILDHENVGINTFVISLSCIISEILHNFFFIMAEANLHFGNIYIYLHIIVILDHENMAADTIFEILSCILLKILNK